MHHVVAVYDQDCRCWRCEVWAGASVIVHVTATVAHKVDAERLAHEWIEVHGDCSRCG